MGSTRGRTELARPSQQSTKSAKNYITGNTKGRDMQYGSRGIQVSRGMKEQIKWLTSRFEKWWKQQRKPGHLKKQLEIPKPWKHKLYRGLNRVNVADVSLRLDQPME